VAPSQNIRRQDYKPNLRVCMCMQVHLTFGRATVTISEWIQVSSVDVEHIKLKDLRK